MTTKTNILILLALLGIASFATGDNKACAQSTIAPQTCDAAVWKTMDARARMETEREIMQNQNLIYKADSVLSYTCFDSLVAHASKNVGILFTHTTYFDGKEIISSTGDDSMDNALQKSVIDVMLEYIPKNFNHSYLGGRGQYVGLGNYSGPKNIENQGASYSCDVMNKVWAVAKCMNFMHVDEFAETDGFFPFVGLKNGNSTTIAGYDDKKNVRNYPTPCGEEAVFPQNATWQTVYNDSKNSTGSGSYDKFYQYGTPMNTIFTEVRKRVDPATSKCEAAPIPTGVTVILSSGTQGSDTYLDGVCTNPGCTYKKGSSGAIGSCVVAAPAKNNNNSGGGNTP